MREITSNEGDRIIIRPNRVIMLLFGNVILEVVRALINRSKERGHIDSRSYHELHAMADRALK